MPRRKASRNAGQQNVSKRWCPENAKETVSNSSARLVADGPADVPAANNLNKRFSSVESHDENSLLMSKQSRHLALVRDYRRMYQRNRRKEMLHSLVQKKIKLARKRMVLAQTKAEGHLYLSGGHL
ncbi:hypothetical protein JTE90_025896 [Oedothorax gibbosus]|uniref:Uncharacterized protein n=1 Tax=Oedothorax gibbosus TaxID=931172 RepID=A0AAV6TJJ9_9ARAC|nr:hypothetical protein JTE90_025896 [Oedothorax gibbosus]